MTIVSPSLSHSPDITHLIVFQSRATADTFKMMLEARVSTGSFLIEGSTDCMKMFDSAMKTGRWACPRVSYILNPKR